MAGSDDKKHGAKGDDAAGRKMKKQKRRPGLPAESSILSEKTFVSPQNNRYRIITTSECDAYDPPDPADKKKAP